MQLSLSNDKADKYIKLYLNQASYKQWLRTMVREAQFGNKLFGITRTKKYPKLIWYLCSKNVARLFGKPHHLTKPIVSLTKALFLSSISN